MHSVFVFLVVFWANGEPVKVNKQEFFNLTSCHRAQSRIAAVVPADVPYETRCLIFRREEAT